jgi:ATP-dependent protease ClpP protease subunit
MLSQLPNDLLRRPQIRLHGKVDNAMLDRFLDQFDNALAAQPPGPILVEVTTTGGDAETGRRIATDLITARERFGADLYFVGKSVVYSAGVTILSAFPPERRYLTQDCMLLVHERRLDKTLELKGAMRAMEALVRDTLAEIESARAMERRAFAVLVEGTQLSLDDLMKRIDQSDWYLEAREAEALGLIRAVL